MINIEFDNTDAEGFREIVNSLVIHGIQSFDPDEISVVRIRDYFDHKWLNYSGSKIEKYITNTNPAIQFVLVPHWNKEITVPPFHPNRVLSESFFWKKGIGSAKRENLHQIQLTTNNRNNFILKRFDKALCFWISSNSLNSKQGCLMVYEIRDTDVVTWYVCCEDKNGWKVTRTKGIDFDHIQNIL